MSAVSIRESAGKLHVSSPYHADFVSVIRCLGGRWSPESRTWAVPAKQGGALRETLLRCYGVDGGLPAPAAAAAPAAPAAAPAPPAPRPAPCRPPTVAEIDAALDDIAPGWRRAEAGAAA